MYFLIAYIISIIMLIAVILDIILKYRRGYGLYGKSFDEEFFKIEKRIDYIGIIFLFIGLTLTILIDEDIKMEVLEYIGQFF